MNLWFVYGMVGLARVVMYAVVECVNLKVKCNIYYSFLGIRTVLEHNVMSIQSEKNEQPGWHSDLQHCACYIERCFNATERARLA